MREFDISPIKDEFKEEIDSVKKFVTRAHDLRAGEDMNELELANIQKTVKGLSYVMMFAAYEKMLRGLCRSLIEVAASFRGKQKNLSTPFRLIGMYPMIQSASNSAESDQGNSKAQGNSKSGVTAGSYVRYWSGPLEKSSVSSERDAKKLNPDFWPDNGSFMQRSQVVFICKFFNLDSAINQLERVNQDIDPVVRYRNSIAHGGQTAAEIGGNSTKADILDLLDRWKERWCAFLDEVYRIASQKDYYLKK